jgi:hypothetical protein
VYVFFIGFIFALRLPGHVVRKVHILVMVYMGCEGDFTLLLFDCCEPRRDVLISARANA